MTAGEALRFIEQHGIVLEAGQGPAPALATEVFGAPIKGSWWAHPRAQAFFRLTRDVRDHPDVLVCKLLAGKITYVHRRLWPALVTLSRAIGSERLTAIREVHTASGGHSLDSQPFPKWVPADVREQARVLARDEAIDAVARAVPLAALMPRRSTHELHTDRRRTPRPRGRSPAPNRRTRSRRSRTKSRR